MTPTTPWPPNAPFYPPSSFRPLTQEEREIQQHLARLALRGLEPGECDVFVSREGNKYGE